MKPCTFLHVLAPFLLATLVTAQGSVHVVDAAGGPGSSFTSLGAAITAAAEGDVVLVRAGTYPDPILLGGKSLVVIAEAGASVQAPFASVENLGPGDAVVIRGVTLSTTTAFSGTLLHDEGPVWFEETTFLGVPVFPTAFNASGFLLVDQCISVVLSSCTLTRPFMNSPLSTLTARTGSRVNVHSSAITSKPGTAAITMEGSFLQLSGSSAVGIDGLSGMSIPFCTAENGGHGLALTGPSRALIVDSLLQGGQGGDPCGLDGQALLVSVNSIVTQAPGASTTFQLPSPVRDDETIQTTIVADPGDLAWILYAPLPRVGIGSNAFLGELLVGNPLDGVFAGTVPASGLLDFAGPAPQLAPGQESAVLFTQLAVLRPGSGFRMGPPSVLVVLDESF